MKKWNEIILESNKYETIKLRNGSQFFDVIRIFNSHNINKIGDKKPNEMYLADHNKSTFTFLSSDRRKLLPLLNKEGVIYYSIEL